MGERTAVDITHYSFEEFFLFLFAHDAYPKTEKRDPWYWHVEAAFDPQRVCAYYVRLFRQPNFLLEQFSKAQLEQAFWGIQVPNLNCSAHGIILDSHLPIAAKEECVRSMFDLFNHLFVVEPLESSSYMWWDSLCYDWETGQRANSGEDLQLQNVMFETIGKILDLNSAPCQRAALHGLGHLHHPDTEKVIDRFIDQHPSLTGDLKEYALAAAKFEVQ